MTVIPTDIACTWCNAATEIRDQPFYGLWLYCTACEWAVVVQVTPGDPVTDNPHYGQQETT